MNSAERLTTDQLWRMLADELRGFLRRRLRDDAIADDLLQETFLRIHRQRDAVRDEESVTSWVYQIARRLIIDYYRRQNNDRATADGDAVVEASRDEAELESNINRAVAAWTRAAIDQLPDTYRAAIRHSELDHLTQQEVAERLGLSLTAAKSRIRRGREMLRGLLHACCAFEIDRRGNFLDATRLGACVVCTDAPPRAGGGCCSGGDSSGGCCGG